MSVNNPCPVVWPYAPWFLLLVCCNNSKIIKVALCRSVRQAVTRMLAVPILTLAEQELVVRN